MIFALLLFIGLLIAGLRSRELDGRNIRVALLILVLGGIIFGAIGAPLVASIALPVIVDMVLLLKVFKGDLRIH